MELSGHHQKTCKPKPSTYQDKHLFSIYLVRNTLNSRNNLTEIDKINKKEISGYSRKSQLNPLFSYHITVLNQNIVKPDTLTAEHTGKLSK